MRLNVPTQLTVVRLILSVVFFILLGQYSQRDPSPLLLDVSIVIFVVAALTDFLDGHLARKHGLVTPLGRILDPLADKVLICGAYILMAGPSFVDANGDNITRISAWMVVIIVCRELLITGLRGFQESKGVEFGAMLHGKIKMWFQSITAPVILLLVAHGPTLMSREVADIIKYGLAYLTVAATVLSVVQYLARSRSILDESVIA
jgi:CDP-diacylglycerol--glycerol-3-phosphate 3-phosphatidyltransferase